MTAIAICDQSDRPHWLRERMNGIGASDLPKILGLNPTWGSGMSVFAEKILDPEYVEEKKTPLQEFGLMCESWLLDHVMDDYGADDCKLDGTLFASADRPHVRCTRDGVLKWFHVDGPDKDLDREKSVELKTRAFDDWDGQIPAHVFAQVQTQAYVLEEPEIIVGVCFRVSGERKFKTVPRDDVFINDVVLPAADEFWERVQKIDASGLEVDGSQWTLKALDKMNPVVVGSSCLLPAEFDDYADELVAIREGDKENRDRKDWLRNQFADAGGENEMLVLPSGRYMNYKERIIKAHQRKESRSRSPQGPFGGEK